MISEQHKSHLPHLQQIVTYEDKSRTVYDVQFYPYGTRDDEPVFAVTGHQHTIVYKLSGGDKGSIERLKWFVDEQEDATHATLCTLTWSFNTETAEPLLCVAGADKRIKILDVASGQLARTLIGHGSLVNDLVTSPVDPSVIASGSEDNSIRIWHLHAKFSNQPCAAILAGEGGHESGILKLAFHANGKYLLSGGFDTKVCLWVLPEYPASPDAPYGGAGVDKVNLIHYPHFCTTALHFHHVDSVTFHGDLVLSKSCRGTWGEETQMPYHNRILLWRITGFNSRKPAPPGTAAPANMRRGIHTTVSAWSDTSTGSGGFQVLMAFECPGTEAYFMRLAISPPLHTGFSTAPDTRQGGPILAMGSHAYDIEKPASKKNKARKNGKWRVPPRIHLWDLDLLAQGVLGQGDVEVKAPRGQAVQRADKGKGPASPPRGSRSGTSVGPRESSTMSEAHAASRVGESEGPVAHTSDTVMGNTGEAEMGGEDTEWGPFTPLKAHRIIEAPSGMGLPADFSPRSIDWTADGRIGVVVGETEGAIWVLRRD